MLLPLSTHVRNILISPPYYLIVDDINDSISCILEYIYDDFCMPSPTESQLDMQVRRKEKKREEKR